MFIIGCSKDSNLEYIPEMLLKFSDDFCQNLKIDPSVNLIDLNTCQFSERFTSLLKQCIENSHKKKLNIKMKTYEESEKSSKTVQSLIKSKDRPGKEKRSWTNELKRNKSGLNFSEKPTQNGSKNSLEKSDSSLELESTEIKGLENFNNKTSSKSSLDSFFSKIGMNKVLTTETMMPALESFKQVLITKNVANDVAEEIIGSIKNQMLGKKIGSFSTFKSAVKEATAITCRNILNVDSHNSLLLEIKSLKGSRPYVITFCGVNGVGKSTNLAKIAFWLLNNGQSILIAACDTFRSGAIEQLKTHIARVISIFENKDPAPKIELFSKGYGKDPATIAMNAIKFAQKIGTQVVLIDTAGRMQDNAPLMANLKKLISLNSPDKVFFVGEALVGNEAVDQVKKFDAALTNDGESKSNIDGIVLTKFDTVDDKVGAAISMSYITSKPIVFVGTGQTYTDLKKLDAKSIVDILLK